MQTRIEKVGDQFGVLLPKELLDACGFGTDATVTVQDNTLVVSPGPLRVREGWAEAARQMRDEGDDLMAELQEWQESPDEWDATEWKWRDSDESKEV